MNFKERGITVGDLLLCIILLISIFLVMKVKESNNDQSSMLSPISINQIGNF